MSKTHMIGNSGKNITIAGLGYVGCVTAACLADLGHNITAVDPDSRKVGCISEGRAPFHEPGLQDLVAGGVNSGRLKAVGSMAAALENSEIVIVCVGTPSEANGNLGLDQLRRVSEEIASFCARSHRPLIVAVRSTVFPGTCEQVVLGALNDSDQVPVVSNPEFLREGSAVRDFMEPSLIVIGGDDRIAIQKVADLYKTLGVEPCLVSLRTAEMIKYACNAFHALKIGFANEIGALCNELSLSSDEVMGTLCRDEKLNISRAYLKPGFAFGGSCLPKDLRALTYRSRRLDLRLPLLESVLPSNEEHLCRGIDRVLSLKSRRIGIYGLAFKENTDDLRESPIVAVIEKALGKGRELRVFDPNIQPDQLYGSNKQFLLDAVPHIGRLTVPCLDELLEWSEHLILSQAPSGIAGEAIRRSGKPVLNLVGAAAESVFDHLLLRHSEAVGV